MFSYVLPRVRFGLSILLTVLAAVVARAAEEKEARLLRFPAVHGNQLVFTYAGDLYTVPSAGGVARRLTSHAGLEPVRKLN